MSVFTTEIASDQIRSDNPLHQRLLKPYIWARNLVSGNVLELGCGEGRGVGILGPQADNYTGIDKIDKVIEMLQKQYQEYLFIQSFFPPLNGLADNTYDFIIAFQVIEHIKNDRLFLEEIYRIMKPGGTLLITTPNIKMSLSRNPWHIREYTADQLQVLAGNIFNKVDMKGVSGNEKVMRYHERNRQSVNRIMKWDILNLQYNLPAFILRFPYEILNRRNRNRLRSDNDELVKGITDEDYLITDTLDDCLDLLLIAKK
jgi:2-polyprenyl-3-methyl-5-hydroxy-6-metoxy-1,4-benzoquinol methylase